MTFKQLVLTFLLFPCFYAQALNTSSHGLMMESTITVIKPAKVVEIGHPVLRQPARELSQEEILTPEIQNLIQQMIMTMRAKNGVGLAAPQIGIDLQIAVIEDINHSHLTAEQLYERQRFPVPLHVIINPRLYFEGDEKADFFEACISIPNLRGIVSRAKDVRVEALNEEGKPITIRASGWYARILQHEIDHLQGTLFIDHAHLKTLMTEDNFDQFWKNESIRNVLKSLGHK